MLDVAEKVLCCIVVIFGLFILPVVWFSSINDGVIQTVVYEETNSFVDEVCTHGYISQSSYQRFVNNLNATNLLYNIEITVGHSYTVPDYEYQTKDDGTTSLVIVGTKQSDEFVYTEDILRELFETDGIYKMSKGDSISVHVTNKVDTTGQRVNQTILRIHDSGAKIFAVAGGVIRDADY